jgi:5-methylcytosine-specific restriction protein A
MAKRAMRFCAWPGCDELTAGRYCIEHQMQHEEKQDEERAKYNRARGSAASQGYGSDWRKVRLSYLREHPLCERCEERGKIKAAEMVHHKVPIKQGGARLDKRNLMALCDACHEVIEGPGRWRRRG